MIEKSKNIVNGQETMIVELEDGRKIDNFGYEKDIVIMETLN